MLENNLSDILTNPDLLKQTSSEALDALINKYPYCQLLYAAKARRMMLTQESPEQFLHIASLHSSDPRFLVTSLSKLESPVEPPSVNREIQLKKKVMVSELNLPEPDLYWEIDEILDEWELAPAADWSFELDIDLLDTVDLLGTETDDDALFDEEAEGDIVDLDEMPTNEVTFVLEEHKEEERKIVARKGGDADRPQGASVEEVYEEEMDEDDSPLLTVDDLVAETEIRDERSEMSEEERKIVARKGGDVDRPQGASVEEDYEEEMDEDDSPLLTVDDLVAETEIRDERSEMSEEERKIVARKDGDADRPQGGSVEEVYEPPSPTPDFLNWLHTLPGSGAKVSGLTDDSRYEYAIGQDEDELASKDKKKKTKRKKKKKDKNKSGDGEDVERLFEESLELDDDILSESLADLLASHGHTKKAKRMYKKLRLKFPEKSDYFAAKINKLKE